MCVQVRAHAVEVLKRTEDEELLYYLLQLVQALRYEEGNDSPLAQFLVQRAVANPTLAFTLHWCCSPPTNAVCYGRKRKQGESYSTNCK